MTTFLAAFALIALAVLGMAVGVMAGRRPIQGSCGGLNKVRGLEGSCAACAGEEQCRRRKQAPSSNR